MNAHNGPPTHPNFPCLVTPAPDPFPPTCRHCECQHPAGWRSAIDHGWVHTVDGWTCPRCQHRGDNDLPPCIGEAMRDTTLGIQRRAAHHEDTER